MVTETAITGALAGLDRIFHNEADFQIEFVRQLEQHTDGIIRPEFRYDRPGTETDGRTAIDVLVLSEAETVAIELKYPKDSFTATASPMEQLGDRVESPHLVEPFDLPSIGAYDMAMYPFWKDVETLEGLVAEGVVDRGYALLLTNYAGCWSKRESGLIGDAFLLYEGRDVSGTLEWSQDASERTHETYSPIAVTGNYRLSWESYDYAYPATGTGATEFQYLLLEASP